MNFVSLKIFFGGNKESGLTVAYPEGFSFRYTGMGTQIVAPKKGDIPLFTVIYISDNVSSF